MVSDDYHLFCVDIAKMLIGIRNYYQLSVVEKELFKRLERMGYLQLEDGKITYRTL